MVSDWTHLEFLFAVQGGTQLNWRRLSESGPLFCPTYLAPFHGQRPCQRGIAVHQGAHRPRINFTHHIRRHGGERSFHPVCVLRHADRFKSSVQGCSGGQLGTHRDVLERDDPKVVPREKGHSTCPRELLNHSTFAISFPTLNFHFLSSLCITWRK